MDRPVVLSSWSFEHWVERSASYRFHLCKQLKVGRVIRQRINTITIQRIGKISNMICWRTEDATEAWE
jgi:hypothetical protein